MSPTDWQHLSLAVVLCALALGVVHIRLQRKKRLSLPLPPGPLPLPILGNIWGINKSAPWLTYTTWAHNYGDLVYSSFLNHRIVVINSETVARKLLEKRSNIYSDRPDIPTNALFGLDFNTVLMRYGDRWRKHRRLFHQAFRSDAAPKYHLMQQQKSHRLLSAILEDPESCFEHLHTYSSSIVLSALYGYEVKSKNDHMVHTVDRALKLAIEEVRPEVAALFTALPFFPSWVPGMDIHRKSAQSREWFKEMLDTPFTFVIQRMKEGTAGPSMVFDALRRVNDSNEEHLVQTIKEASATAFGAASETTASALQVFILAMVLFPEVQKKAQSIIYSTLGPSKLPTWTDRSSLTYIDAVLRETLRWHPILPLSTPHATTDDDVFEGYYIPKGATVVPNVWAMSHDEAKYRNPSDFIPERFLDADGNLTQDTVGFTFGFGRRICVGRHIADASLWYAISGMLALYSFSKARDVDGNEIDFKPQWSSGVAIHPLPFPFTVTPRRTDLTAEDLHLLFDSSLS